MMRPALLACLLLMASPAAAQFNTVRSVKVLPTVTLDTAQAPAQVPFPPFGEAPPIAPVPPVDAGQHAAARRPKAPLASMPLSMAVIASPYGYRRDPFTGEERFHAGIDFKGENDTVLAVMGGVVFKVDYNRGLGGHIELQHAGCVTVYGHLSNIFVRQGQQLLAGEAIGMVGTTGRSTGPHLHFAVKKKGEVVDPAPLLDMVYRLVEARVLVSGLEVMAK